MGVGNSGERSETIILRLAVVNLTTVILDRLLCYLELLSNRWYKEDINERKTTRMRISTHV